MATLPLLDPKRMLILRVVAQTGSISAAARALGWTPPAVSQHLAVLEATVHVPLIHRHRSGVELTEAGAVLVRHADSVASHLESALDDLTALERRDHGTIRLGCFTDSLVSLVPTVLAKLREDSGQKIEILLTEAQPVESVAQLRAGKIDLALIYDFIDPAQTLGPDQVKPLLRPIPADLVGREVGGDDIVVLLSPENSVATQTDLSLTDLAQAQWITDCDLCRDHLEHCASAVGFHPRMAHQTHDSRVIKSLVTMDDSHLTVATLPTSLLPAFGPSDASVRVMPVPGLTGRRFFAVYRPGADQAPAFRHVVEMLQEVGQAKA